MFYFGYPEVIQHTIERRSPSQLRPDRKGEQIPPFHIRRRPNRPRTPDRLLVPRGQLLQRRTIPVVGDDAVAVLPEDAYHMA